MPASLIRRRILALVIILGIGRMASGQPPPPTVQPVVFARGASSAVIKGQLEGDATIDYEVKASAGQTLTVALAPTNRSTSFNVLPPGSADVAMFVSDGRTTYSGKLPADGAYRVRVYLIRAVARRGRATAYSLTIGVTGAPLAPLPGTVDARVAGTQAHATASTPCVPAPYVETKPTTCDAAVIRRAGGAATVVIALGAAGTRHLLFEKGAVTATDANEAVTTSRKGDVTIVTFPSGERHEIPDAFVLGG